MELDDIERLFETSLVVTDGTQLRTERDRGYLELTASRKDGGDTGGRSFRLRTNGVEAFVSVLDTGYSRIDFEYDLAFQIDLVRNLAGLASRYLDGEGEFRQRRTWLHRVRVEFVLSVGGEEFFFNK